MRKQTILIVVGLMAGVATAVAASSGYTDKAMTTHKAWQAKAE
ncbi:MULTISPECIES: hypothetical protein [unclassified Mesorhizobium]